MVIRDPVLPGQLHKVIFLTGVGTDLFRDFCHMIEYRGILPRYRHCAADRPDEFFQTYRQQVLLGWDPALENMQHFLVYGDQLLIAFQINEFAVFPVNDLFHRFYDPDKVAAFRKILAEVAAEHKLPLLDMYTPTEHLDNKPSYFRPDNVHFSPAGAENRGAAAAIDGLNRLEGPGIQNAKGMEPCRNTWTACRNKFFIFFAIPA